MLLAKVLWLHKQTCQHGQHQWHVQQETVVLLTLLMSAAAGPACRTHQQKVHRLRPLPLLLRLLLTS
jgi:hypothetical protein